MKFKKFGALLLSAVLCIGMAAPAFAYEGDTAPVEEPVLPEVVEEEDAVTITDEETGALTPEGNLSLVDDYHTSYSDGSGQQFITLVSKSGATFYLVIDRNAKGQQTVHFMNLVDEADLLTLMEDRMPKPILLKKKLWRRPNWNGSWPRKKRKRQRKKQPHPVLNSRKKTKLQSMQPPF